MPSILLFAIWWSMATDHPAWASGPGLDGEPAAGLRTHVAIVVWSTTPVVDGSEAKIETFADWIDRSAERLHVALQDEPRLTVTRSVLQAPLEATTDTHRADDEEAGSESDQPVSTLADMARRLATARAEYLVVLSISQSASDPPRDLGQAQPAVYRQGYRLTLRVADGKTGQVLFSTRIVDSEDLVRGARRLSQWLTQRPWRGQIVEVDHSRQRVILSAGRAQGVVPGCTFEVLADDEPVLDPDTGDRVGATTVAIGRVQVVGVRDSEAEATIIDGCETVAAGDRIRESTPR